ncbi:hypothetical protein C8F01DRAFT_1116777 [Mycena amicta]|nr:hypothetical protein C8F01DRAFT_1116777 [Mycena amicta]
MMRAEELSRSRSGLVYDLNLVVDEEEDLAQTLLKAFDLDLGLSTSFRQQANHPDTLAEFCSLSFLSTPLRMKHFSKLSPSILRGLLRSPSLRGPSPCDDSLESISSLKSTALPSVATRLVNLAQPDENPNANVLIREPYLPLTPPPTARIPSSELLPAATYVDAEDITDRAAHLPSPLPTAANHLISPATVRHFQRVIDEMKGFSHVPVEPPSILASISRSASPVPDDAVIPLTSTPALNRTFGVLEEEFAWLLQQRAADEEADANQLRELADRLQALGTARRKLAALIADKRCEQGIIRG